MNFLEETAAIRGQLKKLAGSSKKIFWRVQADSPSGKKTTPTVSFLLE